MKQKTKRFSALLASFLLAAALLTACSTGSAANGSAPLPSAQSQTPSSASAPAVELTVSAAASLTDVMKDIGKAYAAKVPNVKITSTFGSSGALQTQIEEGAPSDIFMSAAKKQMDALDQKKLLLDGTRKNLLVNRVVLIVPKGSSAVKSFDDVSTGKVKKIALGEPKSVPVGQYSEEVFTYLKVLDAVKKKAVYGSDVRQVLSWVESAEADCGVVYATDAATSDKVLVAAEAPEASHTPVVYPVSVLKSSKYPDEAKAFLAYLATDEAKALFVKYGFTMA